MVNEDIALQINRAVETLQARFSNANLLGRLADLQLPSQRQLTEIGRAMQGLVELQSPVMHAAEIAQTMQALVVKQSAHMKAAEIGQTMQALVEQQRAQIPTIYMTETIQQLTVEQQNMKQVIEAMTLSQDAIMAATKSFPDFSTFFSFSNASVLDSAFSGINKSINGAEYVAEIDLSNDAAHEEDISAEQAQKRLSELMPSETVEKLQQVEFLPIRALAEIGRNPQAMHNLTPRDFERFIAEVIRKLGFERVILTDHSRDGGRDVLATKFVNGIPILFAFECKKYAASRPVGIETVRALFGSISLRSTMVDKGVLVTTSYFTSGARSILTEPRLAGRDFNGIVEWLEECGFEGR